MQILSEWFDWIKSLHSKSIDLNLERVRTVADRMGLLQPSFIVITVAGTNGKGSTVAGLETIYLEAGYKVGAFTSPYLFRFNEQIRVSGKEVTDNEIMEAFKKIAAACKEITLTQFEFNTLTALEIFKEANLDVVILEVGLGGRLDSTNIIDADVAIVTSIDIDHAEWLGDTREKIGYEKAGIFRAGKPAICGDFNIPQSIMDAAKKIGASLYCQNQQFGFETDGFLWNWWSEKNRFEQLPQPKLLLQNMSCVIMAIELLQTQLPVTREAIDNAFKKINLPGRLQIVEGKIQQIFDVSHNPASVSILNKYLQQHSITGKTRAVFSMLQDKDIATTIAIIKNNIDEWYVAPLNTERAASKENLEKYFQGMTNIHWCFSIKEAYQSALNQVNENDRVVVFGSFHTVAESQGFG